MENKLNELSSKEWLINTKSIWSSNKKYEPDNPFDLPSLLGHEELLPFIKFFTRTNSNVLVIADKIDGIILSFQSLPYKLNSITIISNDIVNIKPFEHIPIINSDLDKYLVKVEPNHFDFVLFIPSIRFLTSFFSINNLTKLESYSNYLKVIENISTQFFALLKPKGHLIFIGSDFYSSFNLIHHHVDIGDRITKSGFYPRGISVIQQENTISSINHTNVLIFEKKEKENDFKPIEADLENFFDKKSKILEREKHSFKSFWKSHPLVRDSLKSKHPATFPESDIEKLVELTTSENDTILDPFLGVGSSLIAARNLKRNGIGIELTSKWYDIAKKRLEIFRPKKKLIAFISNIDEMKKNSINRSENDHHEENYVNKIKIILGDSKTELKKLDSNIVDLIVTSPPYWGILNKKLDHKTKSERVKKGLDTKYSTDPEDLANITDYSKFLDILTDIFKECNRILKENNYMVIIVSNFRNKSNFYSYHGDIVKMLMIKANVSFVGSLILAQENKNLYPYGYPASFVSNIHHQNILVFRKNKV